MFKNAYMEHEEKLSPRLRELVVRLREMVFSRPRGERLGREAELCGVLGCSTTMLRQAARQLEVQGLLSIRRGVNGGYIGRRPTSVTVIDIAAVYLRSHGVTLGQILDGCAPSAVHMAETAARLSAASPVRPEMAAFLETLSERFPEDASVAEFIDEEAEIDDMIYRMADLLPLALYLKIANRYAREKFGTEMFERQPKRRVRYRNLRLDTLRAILSGDDARAAMCIRQTMDLIADWLPAGILSTPILST